VLSPRTQIAALRGAPCQHSAFHCCHLTTYAGIPACFERLPKGSARLTGCCPARRILGAGEQDELRGLLRLFDLPPCVCASFQASPLPGYLQCAPLLRRVRAARPWRPRRRPGLREDSGTGFAPAGLAREIPGLKTRMQADLC
jgi:hypothetical protein